MSNVKICIHQSADKIGGNCIEIVAGNGERLLLDAGRPLDISSKEKTPLPDSLDILNSVAGVLISHAHADHFGMLESIPLSWNIYCSKITKSLIEFNTAFLDNKLNNPFITLKNGKNLIGSFKVKPFLIDHSAIDAYAFLIEVDGKRIFYSGDIRAHGRKAKLTKALIDKPLKNIDVLLLEGTNLITTNSSAKSTKSEDELQTDFTEAFNSAKDNKIFVTWSAQNLDRVVTIYKAANKANRKTVVDLYSMYILSLLAEHGVTVPNPEWEKSNLLAVVTSKMIKLLSCKIGKDRCDEFIEYLKSKKCARSVDGIAKTPEKYVILVRDGLVEDYSKIVEGKSSIMPTSDDLWIWSMWSGYLKEDSTAKTREYLKDCKKQAIHTSGHAPTEKLIEIVEAIKPKMLIPIHGENWKENEELFTNINIVENGQWVELESENKKINKERRIMRSLSPEFMDDLLNGILNQLLVTVKEDDTLMLAIRENYINIYYRGGSILKLIQQGSGTYSASFDENYSQIKQVKDEISSLPKAISEAEHIDKWINNLGKLKGVMDKYFSKSSKLEREFQQLVVRENNKSSISNETEYFIADIELANSEIGARFDMLAFNWPANARKKEKVQLALIEMKYGDKALGGSSGVEKHLKDINKLIENPSLLYETASIQINQLNRLGLLKHKRVDERNFEIDEDGFEIIFLFANSIPRSQKDDSSKLLDVLRSLKEKENELPENVKLHFFVANSAGYAMHNACMFTLDEYINFTTSMLARGKKLQ